MSNAEELIAAAQQNPPKPVITDLLNESEIAGLHGAPEVFKTLLSLQVADALASGKTLLGIWDVPEPRSVYFFETEMSVPALGNRLRKIYTAHTPHTPPVGIHFAGETQLRRFRRVPDLQQKFDLLTEWVEETKADILILDTANPFFRGRQSPNEETTAGAFFDYLEAVPASTKLFVRHNHKPRIDDVGGDSATRIRGSGQFADVPDLLLELRRPDKRTNQAILSVSKYRHGSKPDDLPLWLDASRLRLVSIPPVVYLLQSGPRTRPELLGDLETRFGVKQRMADELIKEQQVYLRETLRGHTRIFEIDWSAAREADWYYRIECRGSNGGDARGFLGDVEKPVQSSPAMPEIEARDTLPREREELMQPCINTTVSLSEPPQQPNIERGGYRARPCAAGEALVSTEAND